MRQPALCVRPRISMGARMRFADKLLYTLTRGAGRVVPGVRVRTHWPSGKQVLERTLAPLRRPIAWQLAVRHRRRLAGTTFVGVTGSAGKTTTKDMIAAVLRSRYSVSAQKGSANFAHNTARSVLAVRAADEFCALELSAGEGPGHLRRQLDLVEPAIAVVTNIGSDHYRAFGSVDAIADEKGLIIRTLPTDGVAVLNADDPRVIAMAASCRARVVSYGLSDAADVQARSIDTAWPGRLSFDLVHGGVRTRVSTQLCGPQWVSAALAAASVGLALGVPMDDIVRALAGVEPYEGRMSPLVQPDGVTFIRDDWKASIQTIPPALDFLGAARAARKIAIIGTISDISGDPRARYSSIARSALAAADVVAFVGPRAPVALRAKRQDERERLHAFATVKAAAEFFSAYLRAGDLVLLKGSNGADHLYRIALSRTSDVACWRMDCRKSVFCDSCGQVGTATGPTAGRQAGGEARVDDAGPAPGLDASLMAGRPVVIGLGNFGARHANTPHNVGHALVDRLADEADAAWHRASRAQVACVEWRDLPICLVKCRGLVNHSGSVLHELFAGLDLAPEQAVLVFDDIHMPLGKVRVRMRGSDGGHLGVRSILESFQTDEFRRIKIGVQRQGHRVPDAIRRPFGRSEKPVVAAAIDEACEKLDEVLHAMSAKPQSAAVAV